MDFDSNLTDHCRTCYPRCQSYTMLAGAQEIKKPRSNGVSDRGNLEVNESKHKRTLEMHDNCFPITNEEDYELSNEVDQTTRLNAFESHDHHRNLSIGGQKKSKTVSSAFAEEKPEQRKCYFPPQLSREEFLELEEKVNFVFHLFKGYGNKMSGDVVEQVLIKNSDTSIGEIWNMFNLNKRMCAAEEGIKKLAIILQDILNKCSRTEDIFDSEDSNYYNLLNLDRMTAGKRIAVLKNRNDLLISLIKTFLTIGSVEDIYSQLPLLSKEENMKQSGPTQMLNANPDYQMPDTNQEEIMNIIKKLREHLDKTQLKKQHLFTACDNQARDVESGGKLDVISEQAEFNLKENSSLNINNLKEVSIQYLQEAEKLGLNSTTSRLLAHEALLKSSLDKVHTELLSNLYSAEKNFLKSIPFSPKRSATNDGKNFEENESDIDSISDRSSDLCEPEIEVKFNHREIPQVSAKYSKLSDYKDSFKNLSSQKPCNESAKPNADSNKNRGKVEQKKSRISRKIANKGISTILKPSSKSREGEDIPTELTSGGRKKSVTSESLRPKTAPISAHKSSVCSDLRKLTTKNVLQPSIRSERSQRGICSNVKSQNKNLINKKIFVQTS